jgi:SAM-dependent methyltransferase
MSSTGPLDAHFERTAYFAALHAAFRERGVDQTLDDADKEMDGGTDHYFDVGVDAMRLCVQALVASGRGAPDTILDFPSGSGRVTRHLVSFFPDAHVTACDLYPAHVDFCTSTFGVDGVVSDDDLDAVDFGRTFDLIFCGSLLTHLPAKLTKSAISLMIRSLSLDGVAVMTLHGRQSVHIQKNEWNYVPPKRFEKIERGFRRSGYGYNDYDGSLRGRFSSNAAYGVSVAKPSWTLGVIEDHEDVRVISYSERAWDRQQDVLVVGRPSAFQP